jgi:hypothetical protein
LKKTKIYWELNEKNEIEIVVETGREEIDFGINTLVEGMVIEFQTKEESNEGGTFDF